MMQDKLTMKFCKVAIFGIVGLFCLTHASQSLAQSLLDRLEQQDANQNNGTDAPPTRNDIRPTDVIKWLVAGHEYDAKTRQLRMTLVLKTEQDFTIYEDKLKFEVSEGWNYVSTKTPPTAEQFDPITRKNVNVYTGGPFELVFATASAPAEAEVSITYVGCTKVICLFPYTERIRIPIVQSGAVETKTSANDQQPSASDQTSERSSSSASSNATFEEQLSQRVKTGSISLAMLVVIAFFGGLLTNLTPCVAPMIPITIRLLAHQTVRPITSSIMYALGIVATYTILGLIAAMSGALFGNLIAHPAVSITFGVVMFALGLSMLGFGDLSKLQQIGGQIGSSRGGAFNSLLMGAGAGLVASPCTGPILAALLTYTAGRQNALEAAALLGTYSVGFALPYVFLGASAAKLSKIRVNFRLQILTKLVFASVMFALSLYFLRIPLYGLFTALRPYWPAIGTIFTAAGVILSVIMIMRSSLHQKKLMMLIPTIALGVGLFFGIQALTRKSDTSGSSVAWYRNEQEAFAAAKESGKPILVDAWAEWCEACKKMDVTTFVDPDVIAEMNQNWIALKYDLTEMNDTNDAIQARYELPGLPTLTLLPPSGELSKKQMITGYTNAASLLEHLRKFNKSFEEG
jgi:thiol:disulfide interchange protein DsbD